MPLGNIPRSSQISSRLLAGTAVLLAASGAWAQSAPPGTQSAQVQSVPTETITITGAYNPDAAASIAPTATPLTATEPTRVISQDFIEKNMPLTTNYDEIIQISPSVSTVTPNGPGMSESQLIQIRGFQDGYFNVTFDGIPWQDSNDFTHHSTSYFVDHVLGEASLDLSPGNASTIGNATFCCTVGILSKAPSDTMSVQPYMSFGSFNTQIFGAEIDTGTIDSTGGTRVMMNGEGDSTDGYLTNMGLQRENGFIKVVQPVSDTTTLTVVGAYNTLKQYISLGSTAAEISKYGANYALSRDPTSQNFYGYNQDQIQTDFEYFDLQSNFGDGWNLDAKAYTYAYYHRGENGEDPNGETPNGTTYGANDVPGQLLENNYRSLGTIARLKKDIDGFGDIQSGVWFDHQINTRALYEVDWTLGGAINPINPSGAPDGIDRLLHQHLDSLQPYVQADWKVFDGLTVSPGVRYSYFDRNVNADVNVKTGSAQQYDNSFGAWLPSVSIHYAVDSEWAIYAQTAKGFLAPNENFFNFQNPTTATLNPQETWSYQAGTTFQNADIAADFDGYYIDFNNEILGRTVQGITTFYNEGGTIYKGIEADLTYKVGAGFSLYGNGSLNSAKDKASGTWLPNAPKATWSLGVIYDHDGLYGSVIEKWVGPRYGDVGTQYFDPYGTMNLSTGYTWNLAEPWMHKLKIQVEVQNLLDNTKSYALAGYTASLGTPLYWTIPGRSIFVSLAATL